MRIWTIKVIRPEYETELERIEKKIHLQTPATITTKTRQIGSMLRNEAEVNESNEKKNKVIRKKQQQHCPTIEREKTETYIFGSHMDEKHTELQVAS